MNTSAAAVMEQALSLPVGERALVARQLLLSLEENDDETTIEDIWQEEIVGRLRDLQSGKVVGLSWEEAKSQILRRIHDQT